ncbi:MAG: N-acetylmuramoyl-L-alanine amidase [Oligoflexia bacterium]|nr:N-acetylmuramoyl-L-alanine amidase [Oligoflexia bacterium]
MNRLVQVVLVLLVVLAALFTYRVRGYVFVGNEAEETETGIEIRPMPVVFDAQRRLLTALYREKHTGDCDHRLDGFDVCISINPRLVVIHMTGLPTLGESYEYMKEPVLREERESLINRSFDRLNVSAHYLVDTDGTIYSLMPDNYMARHAMGVNHISIGVENVGVRHTGEQVASNIKLLRFLMKRYTIEKVISHTEVDALASGNNEYYVEKMDDYFRHKDCGDELAAEVRRGLGI